MCALIAFKISFSILNFSRKKYSVKKFLLRQIFVVSENIMRNNLVLRTFQEDGVRFMIDRENSPEAGGIQADEMGLGKTIQTIAVRNTMQSLNRKGLESLKGKVETTSEIVTDIEVVQPKFHFSGQADVSIVPHGNE
jgi:SNF2 family DNA or RNA helicase